MNYTDNTLQIWQWQQHKTKEWVGRIHAFHFAFFLQLTPLGSKVVNDSHERFVGGTIDVKELCHLDKIVS